MYLQKLRAELELWRSVAESLPDIVVQFDREGRVVYVNREQYSATLGRYLPDLASDPDDRARLRLLVEHLLTSDTEESGFSYVDNRVQAVLVLNSGSTAFEYTSPSGAVYECRAAPIRHRGEIVGAALAIRDVTEQRHTQRDLAAATAQLAHAQKLSAIGQLAAGIAHEINTPVQFVMDNTTFLQSAFARIDPLLEAISARASADPSLAPLVQSARLPKLRSQIPRAITQSLDGLGRVAKIVSAMKDFSHPSDNKKESVSLAALFETTATISRNEWKYVAELEIDVPQDLPSVPLLRDEFNQVVLNLIVNAAHAIAERYGDTGTLGHISLSARDAGGSIEIRIRDDGTGISEEIRSRVFEPFFTTKPVGKGTGQGLAIAWSVVVERHGGTIGLESEVGVGTCFVIHLPTEPAP